MKKLLLTAAALFTIAFANAQDEPATQGFSKGDVFISGGAGFLSTKTGNEKANGFNISPRAAYFVTSHIAVGALLSYAHTKQDGNYTTAEQKDNVFQANAFGRYYFTPASNFSFFGELSAGYLTSKQEYEADGYTLKRNGFSAALTPGISYFVSSHFAIEASLGILSYNSVKPKRTSPNGNNTGDATNTFNLGVNLTNINFGLVYKF